MFSSETRVYWSFAYWFIIKYKQNNRNEWKSNSIHQKSHKYFIHKNQHTQKKASKKCWRYSISRLFCYNHFKFDSVILVHSLVGKAITLIMTSSHRITNIILISCVYFQTEQTPDKNRLKNSNSCEFFYSHVTVTIKLDIIISNFVWCGQWILEVNA